ncbi:MBL fold metallo-hydrolase [Pelagibius litoralis]|uniref:MBL fold metallo-hydrolase n=2 Tax=Pelagibius litoralis TaxID=374515 RepID=A0A967F094_9PROT|nr:MBL fold metallo-hydrolase [Pelagibius litoralis]
MARPAVEAFFDEATFTVSYVVADPASGRAAIIDSVLDYDPKSGRSATGSADRVIAFVEKNGLGVDWILETHVHADHLSAAPYLKKHLGGRIGIGAQVCRVQEAFKTVYNLKDDFAADGSQFDYLFRDDETFAIGGLQARVMATPGHTPACITYLIGDAAFVGDTLFMPDYGSARTDFPGGDARQLYHSVKRILSLPSETRLFLCHDYKAPGRDVFAWETTVAEQRSMNIHMRDGISEADFVALREGRDAGLSMPVLLLPAVQVNMRAGQFPPPEDNGVSYLKIPVNGV